MASTETSRKFAERRTESGTPVEIFPIDYSAADVEYDPPLKGIVIQTAGILVVKLASDPTVSRQMPSGLLATGVAHPLAVSTVVKASSAAVVWGYR